MKNSFYLDDYQAMLEHFTQLETVHNENAHALLEMAFSRREFVSKTVDRIKLIIDNLAVLRYANRYGVGMPTINHWKAELAAVLLDVISMHITKNDSVNNRTKAFGEAFEKRLDLSTLKIETILAFVLGKCDQEQLLAKNAKSAPIYDKQNVYAIAQSVYDDMGKIVTFLSDPKNKFNVQTFVNQISQ